MAKYFNRFITNLSPEQAGAVIDNFYTVNKFKPYKYMGESWMKLGKGFLAGPQVMRVFVQGNVVTIEAFVRYALLPGVYVGEIELDNSFFLTVPKTALKAKISNLEMQLGFNPAFQYQQMGGQYTNMQMPNVPQYNNYQNTNNLPNDNQVQAKLCPKCGRETKAESAFCMYCGNKF